jgi:hypothetical protein
MRDSLAYGAAQWGIGLFRGWQESVFKDNVKLTRQISVVEAGNQILFFGLCCWRSGGCASR